MSENCHAVISSFRQLDVSTRILPAFTIDDDALETIAAGLPRL